MNTQKMRRIAQACTATAITTFVLGVALVTWHPMFALISFATGFVSGTLAEALGLRANAIDAELEEGKR